MLTWPDPDTILEANGDSDARRAQRANKAAQEVIKEYTRLEDTTADRALKQLQQLRAALTQRLGAEFLTDFKRHSLDSLLRDVDRLIADTTKAITDGVRKPIEQADGLGDQNGIMPMQAAGLRVATAVAMPGVDLTLVQATFGNMVDLLTPPMQQFATELKTSLRRVALAGDGRMTEIKRLRDHIQGKGFDQAQYRAERMIRTELGRTFNESTYGKLAELGKQFKFIRKCWRCTRDSRTRIGHVQAAAQYMKGKGIPISERFQLKVYNERPGKAPVLVGTAFLRFPIDPLVEPSGRVGAAATIMCRCNSFVDFDMADFAAHTRQQVTLALGGAAAPAPELPAADAPAIPVKPKRVAKPRVPKVPTVKALTGAPISTAAAPISIKPAVGPNGPKVSGHLQMRMTNPKHAAILEATLAKLDSVHGDGVLPSIPVTPVPPRHRRSTGAGYASNGRGRAVQLMFGSKLLQQAPNMTVFHEVGHFLDDQAFGDGAGVFGSQGANPTRHGLDSKPAVKVALDGLRDAMVKSKSYQTLVKWSRANMPPAGIRQYQPDGSTIQAFAYEGPAIKPGEGGVPHGTDREMLTYMLRSKETFARAYAQYVATRSGDPAALKELQQAKLASEAATKGVGTERQVNNPVLTGKKYEPGTWSYPWQWSDEDFEPIQRAFDQLFEASGWRK